MGGAGGGRCPWGTREGGLETGGTVSDGLTATLLEGPPKVRVWDPLIVIKGTDIEMDGLGTRRFDAVRFLPVP
ncbi:hypothetical protein HPP92_007398 [Vanilla planifolia]|uniref:Uncharacterized protein n=1 Tax=Vanilla planifolia TaxID=51239 RepID=A0A835V7Y2_VANPL|nr:hypothetical protein HPP92_007563 [Vanilla planifolia]KAG0490535.1 hypothetical protein HPP92_007398 [Vanilla planifolia]